ncbi:hypothetical protein ACQPWY_14310 [Pseudonocardia xinjiangensis]|uniref:hypothetical protein n=1 Tax=Pseudonocardia xinjiangensis TaxID=75289 RepID=UPI003D949FA9
MISIRFRTDFLDGSSLQTAATVIDDYAETGGRTRAWSTATNSRQQGDPAKAARVIADITEAAEQPARLQLGADCVARVTERLDAIRAELDAWRTVAESIGAERLTSPAPPSAHLPGKHQPGPAGYKGCDARRPVGSRSGGEGGHGSIGGGGRQELVGE